MEHILQFGISIDDQYIQEQIQKKAYEDIVKELMKDAKKNLPKKSYYIDEVDWTSIASDVVKEMLEPRKDEIIELAATKLADSYKRTRVYKDRMLDVIDEIIDDDI